MATQRTFTTTPSDGQPPVPIQFAAPGSVNSHSFTRAGFQRLIRGVYARTPDVTDLEFYYRRLVEFTWRCLAVMAVYKDKGAVLYGVTALQILGVALPEELQDWDNCHILLPGQAARPRRKGVIAHHSEHPVQVWREVSGLPVPHPVELWLQLGNATVDQMVEVGDGFLRRQDPLLTRDEMGEKLQSCAGWRGAKLARKAFDLVMEGTDSLPETSTRLALVHAGLPTPLVNPPVRCTPGSKPYHLDMAYDKPKIGVEYDGGYHFETPAQIQDDVLRRRLLQDHGWIIIQVTAPDLGLPERFVRSVETALIMRGGS